MEIASMGRVTTEATIENLGDLLLADRGLLPRDQVRRIQVADALVDTGATLLAMPTRMIQQLGLDKRYVKKVNSMSGVGETTVYGTVRLTIKGRECPADVMEVPDSVPVLIGQIPLEYLDFVVDARGQQLTGNPAHGGEHMFELF
jgi:predicted aspartyl protease